MISGAHVIIYSKDADADRAFLRDLLQLTHVDVGGGWLIFGLPPAEVAVHPSERGGSHELYLMCDDVERFRAAMQERSVETGPVQNMGWGLLSDVALPGGGKLGVYQPRHARPEPMGDGATKPPAAQPRTRRPAKKSAAKKPAKKPAVKKPAKKPAAKKRR